jgi:hypothetical protein
MIKHERREDVIAGACVFRALDRSLSCLRVTDTPLAQASPDTSKRSSAGQAMLIDHRISLTVAFQCTCVPPETAMR